MPTEQSPENQRWWSDFHAAHGMDSEIETAFLGYLHEQGIEALEATPEALDQAWADFQTYWQASTTPPPPERSTRVRRIP